MNTKYLALALGLCFAAGLAQAEEKNTPKPDDKTAPKDKKDKISYSMGYNTGSNWKRNGFETNDVDLEVFMNGIRDSMFGHPAQVSEQENQELLRGLQSELRTRVQEKRRQLGEKNKKEGEAFLAENKSKAGVQTLPDGLQYKVITEGTGPKPTTNDTVSVNYRGTLLDGTEFDSSFKRGQPASFRVTGVIKGWTEALQMMPVGSKWRLFIPSELAYGERGQGMNIGPNAVLTFEIELLSIQPQEKPAATSSLQQPVTSDIIKVPSAEELKKGAKIEIIKPDQIEKEKEKEKQKEKK
jgi:FKBP-type peptidyl-prolyl cis-trans isomerase FklB